MSKVKHRKARKSKIKKPRRKTKKRKLRVSLGATEQTRPTKPPIPKIEEETYEIKPIPEIVKPFESVKVTEPQKLSIVSPSKPIQLPVPECWLEIMPRENQELRPYNLILFIQHMYNRGEPFEFALVHSTVKKLTGTVSKVRYLIHVPTSEDLLHIKTMSDGWGFYALQTSSPSFRGPFEGIVDLKNTSKPAPRLLPKKGEMGIDTSGIEVKAGEVSIRTGPAFDAWSASEHLHQLIANEPGSAILITAQKNPSIIKKLNSWAESGAENFGIGVAKELGRTARGVTEELLRGDGLSNGSRDSSHRAEHAEVERIKRVQLEEEKRNRMEHAESRAKEMLLLCDIRVYGPYGFAEKVAKAIPSSEVSSRCFKERPLKLPTTAIHPPKKPSFNDLKRSINRLSLYAAVALIAVPIIIFAVEYAFNIQLVASFLMALAILAGVGCIGAYIKTRVPNLVVLSVNELAAIISIPVGFRSLPSINIMPAKPLGEIFAPKKVNNG